MNQFPTYQVGMEETHHTQKLDAPSGTAITLAEGILNNIERKTEWALGEGKAQDPTLTIKAIREGMVPGIHTIQYESDFDYITITHDAKNRNGFALGAVLAAEFACGKKGCLGMKDMLKF